MSWFCGRDQQLSDASVMTQSLTFALAAQLAALVKVKQGLSAEVQRAIKARYGIEMKVNNVSGNISAEPVAASASYSPSGMHRLIGAFVALLAARKKNAGSPPVICIDEAHVLTERYEGDEALQTDLQALLSFFIRVRRFACCCTTAPAIHPEYASGDFCSLQITREEPLAHVILATYDYSFSTWLSSSEPPSLVLSSHALAAASPSSLM